VISATRFGSTQWTRDSTSGEPKRVERGGRTLRGDVVRDVHFERMWNAAQPMDEFEPAIKALEPK
jgi:hypothetical protein